MSIREIGARNKKFPNAIPVYSIDKKEDAENLQTILCSLTTDGRNVLTKFAGGHLELEDLNDVGDFLDRAHRKFNLKEEGVEFRAW